MRTNLNVNTKLGTVKGGQQVNVVDTCDTSFARTLRGYLAVACHCAAVVVVRPVVVVVDAALAGLKAAAMPAAMPATVGCPSWHRDTISRERHGSLIG